MSIVLSSRDLLKGKTSNWDKYSSLVAPIQMIQKSEKDDAWKAANLDWYEHIGIAQVRAKAKRLLKWYNMAEGLIDKEDYIREPSNDYADMIDVMSAGVESPMNIQFYPIVPNIVNVLVGEFEKRNNRVLVKAVDPYSINEMLEKKKDMMTQSMIAKAQAKILQKLAQQGLAPDSEEAQQELQKIPSLPEIQQFFNKSYRGTAEIWATHELAVADERFKLYELEATGFRDSIIAGEEYWHIRLTEDDYEVELWNPITTFSHKSDQIKYVSDGNFVGRVALCSIPEIIDRLGYLMTKDQIKSLEKIMTARADYGRLASTGYDTTDYYDTTRKPDQQNMSIHWNQAMSMKYTFENNTGFLDWITKEDDDIFTNSMVRLIEVYWKSQKLIGHLKQINDLGEVFEDIVTEDFVVTEKPIYDTSLTKGKTKDNLIYGQHIDWVWTNQVWKGKKIGLNYLNGNIVNDTAFEPIYLDVAPLEFQFKGDSSIYGCKLPVEGCSLADRNVRKNSFVGMIGPFQVGFNFCNNQLMDMAADEVGNIVLFDQNMLPKHSMDGSWGKYNFVKAYTVAKNFQFLPIDTSKENTEVPTNWNQTQQVNLEKTNMIASRIKMCEYFKSEALAVVGINPQRLGDIGISESATGVQAAQANSYNQTNHLFTQHMQNLMPRVKQMILDAAQYVNSKKPSVRTAYMNAEEENVFFEIEGTKLLLAQFNIYCTGKADQKAVIDQLKQLAINNNTSNASIFDLAKVLSSDSISEILNTLKMSVDKAQQAQQQAQDQEYQIQQQQIAASQQAQQEKQAFEAQENELDRANERYLAEVKSLGFSKDQDINSNQIPDPLEVAKFNAELGKHSEDILFKRSQEQNKMLKEQRDADTEKTKLAFEKEKLRKDVEQKEKDRKVARENMDNDLQIEKIRAKNRAKPKK